MSYGTCKICGCTDRNACYHPDFGACWWVDESHEICSHCIELKEDPIKFTPDQKLLALSWKQPYAELMLHGKIETRVWNTNYRGWVLICASKQGYHTEQLRRISGGNQLFRMGKFLSIDNPGYEGQAIGIGRLVDCRPMELKDEDSCFVYFFLGLYCHVYENIHEIEPFPWKGCQGWKEVSPEVKLKINFK